MFRYFLNRLQNYKKYFIYANFSLQFRLFCHYLHKKRQFSTILFKVRT